MGIFNTVGKTLSEGISRLEEKNRRSAYLNRIRAVLKREEKAAQREYIALGRYYYNNLRNPSDPTAEKHCAELENITGRIEAAIDRLETCYAQMAQEKAAQYEEIDLDDVQCLEEAPAAPEKPAAQNTRENMKESIREAKDCVRKDFKEGIREARDSVREEVKESIRQGQEGAREGEKAVYQEMADSRDQVLDALKTEADEIKQAATDAFFDMKESFQTKAKAADENENDFLPFE